MELRRIALHEAPHAFASSPEDDYARTLEAVRESLKPDVSAVTIGAIDSGLIGSVALLLPTRVKFVHKATIVGMYVHPDNRGRGVGKQLLDAAIEYARTLKGVTSVRLDVSETAYDAKAMYEKAGFIAWGVEPDALCVDGELLSEIHMMLSIPGDGN